MTVGDCVVGLKISSYWLDKMGVSCVLVTCTELVSICNDTVTVHMRIRGRRRVWLMETIKKYVVLLTELRWCSISPDELLSCLWAGSSGLQLGM